MLLFILIDTFLYACGNQLSLFLGLAGALSGTSHLQRLVLGLFRGPSVFSVTRHSLVSSLSWNPLSLIGTVIALAGGDQVAIFR
ncbi:MAG: hypothetical protein P8171_07830 [Candidatus Thiodiazotropha sp.]